MASKFLNLKYEVQCLEHNVFNMGTKFSTCDLKVGDVRTFNARDIWSLKYILKDFYFQLQIL